MSNADNKFIRNEFLKEGAGVGRRNAKIALRRNHHGAFIYIYIIVGFRLIDTLDFVIQHVGVFVILGVFIKQLENKTVFPEQNMLFAAYRLCVCAADIFYVDLNNIGEHGYAEQYYPGGDNQIAVGGIQPEKSEEKYQSGQCKRKDKCFKAVIFAFKKVKANVLTVILLGKQTERFKWFHIQSNLSNIFMASPPSASSKPLARTEDSS